MQTIRLVVNTYCIFFKCILQNNNSRYVNE